MLAWRTVSITAVEIGDFVVLTCLLLYCAICGFGTFAITSATNSGESTLISGFFTALPKIKLLVDSEILVFCFNDGSNNSGCKESK